jgi:biopolymer transport protein ExbD
MAFGKLDGDDDDVMSQINMTPLIDVMLVLLIIFIITIPVIHAGCPSERSTKQSL